jgi:UDP-N-acetylglucosamine--N-acetylmuramyl-(pentapeptide) pyrophosphoryl-undecaprenol N-acetylglucosamine transferase
LLKGGFVGVPIGLAASRLKIPFVTHDSDALPGLANRLVGRWARYHATGMPAEFYSYDPVTIQHVGVLVGAQYQLVTPELQAQYRQELNIPADAEVLMITGGSNGAQAINLAATKFIPGLIQQRDKLHVIHQVGPGNESVYGEYHHERLTVQPLLKGMYRYSGAADVIITRAGANTLAEFGVQAKACIVVPNPLLTGGHQLKNAEHLAGKHAVRVVDEAAMTAEQGNPLHQAVVDLLNNPTERQQLSQALHALTVADAADKLAELLIQVGVQARAGQ